MVIDDELWARICMVLGGDGATAATIVALLDNALDPTTLTA
jgi:hypothetical protein